MNYLFSPDNWDRATQIFEDTGQELPFINRMMAGL